MSEENRLCYAQSLKRVASLSKFVNFFLSLTPAIHSGKHVFFLIVKRMVQLDNAVEHIEDCDQETIEPTGILYSTSPGTTRATFGEVSAKATESHIDDEPSDLTGDNDTSHGKFLDD